MPFYNLNCPKCGAFFDGVLCKMSGKTEPVHLRSGDPAVCADCDVALLRDRRPEVTARTSFGYSATGTDFGIQGGEVFHTAAERREYEEKHKITGLYSKNDPHAKYLQDEANHEADLAAKQQGYKDHRSYRKEKARRNRIKKGQLKSFERRVQVGG